MASMAAAAPPSRPVRLFIYWVPHGFPFEFVSDGNFLEGSTILGPLAPYAKYTTLIRGININSQKNTHEALPAVLTGHDDGLTDSIDALIADQLGVTPHVLGAVPYKVEWGFGKDSQLARHGSWIRATESPVEAANALFAGLASNGGGGGGAVDQDALFRAQALSLTERELETVAKAMKELSSESSKLNLHLEAVRSLKATGQQQPGILSCDARPDLPAVQAAANLDPMAPQNLGAMLDAHLEASAAAMACGSAQIVTLQNMWTNSDISFDFPGGPGVAGGHHEPISHSQNAAGRQQFAACQRWFYERLAEKMLATLDTPDPADTDPSRTVLDNTIIYVCSEVGDGFQHNKQTEEVWIDGAPQTAYLPALVIGRGGGYFAGNQTIDVDRFNTDLLATIADAMGVTLHSIADKPVSLIEELKA